MRRPSLRSEKAADRSPARILRNGKGSACHAKRQQNRLRLWIRLLWQNDFRRWRPKARLPYRDSSLNRPDVANIGMGDPAKIGQAFFELTTKLMADPRPVARAQIELWEQSVSLWARTLRHLLGGEPPPVSAPDKRFKHPEWAENAIFSYIRDSYLLSARAILSAVRGVKGLDEETSRKVEFYTKQFVDALAPSNFAGDKP